MDSEQFVFAGVEISSGRKPVTLAVLSLELSVVLVEKCAIPDAISLLSEKESVQLAINTSGTRTGADIHSDFKRKLKPAGFNHSSKSEGALRWNDVNPEDCYRAFRPDLFPKRTLEGRLQRALILYEEGIQIPDPMDFFEEITRHRLLQGLLPTEIIYSIKQLDALVAAYISWLVINRPHRVITSGDLILPKVPEDS